MTPDPMPRWQKEVVDVDMIQQWLRDRVNDEISFSAVAMALVQERARAKAAMARLRPVADAYRRLTTAIKLIKEWMAEQGRQGNLVTNGQSPHWSEYESAQLALDQALAAIGELPE